MATKYAVLFRRGERTPNLDELYTERWKAERRVEELQHMFDWLEMQSGGRQPHRDVWVEERDLS